MHSPVLLEEAVGLLDIRPDGIYVDGTAGSGGHTDAILERLNDAGRVIALDRDGDAVERCRERFAQVKNVDLIHSNYSDMLHVLEELNVKAVDGILLDLGISSDQLAVAERGFSFQADGPLDMRMDREQEMTAADIINSASESDISAWIWKWGEDRSARRIAAAVVKARPIETTGQLAAIVEHAKGGRRGRIHPATQTFQALRIVVNEEFYHIEKVINEGFDLLKPNGRMAVITFHSLEDRIVKNLFKRHVGRWESLQAGGERWVGELPKIRWINKKPVTAGADELKINPRARSAKLRVVERIDYEPEK